MKVSKCAQGCHLPWQTRRRFLMSANQAAALSRSFLRAGRRHSESPPRCTGIPFLGRVEGKSTFISTRQSVDSFCPTAPGWGKRSHLCISGMLCCALFGDNNHLPWLIKHLLPIKFCAEHLTYIIPSINTTILRYKRKRTVTINRWEERVTQKIIW